MNLRFYFPKSSTKWLFGVIILKILGTLLVLFVYSRVTNVADSGAYTDGELVGKDWLNRTYLVGNVAYSLARIVGASATPFMFSIISALGIWLILMEFPSRMRPKVLPVFLLPSVFMWTSMVSKETLASFFLCLIIWWWIRWLHMKTSFLSWSALIVGLFFYWILRPHYAIAVTHLCAVSILLTPKRAESGRGFFKIPWPNISRLSNGLLLLIFIACVAFNLPEFSDGVNSIIEKALGYFPNNGSRANRHAWLGWTNAADFWNNAWWAIPFGVVGPLPSEVITRPIFLVNFIEGLFLLSFPIFGISILSPSIWQVRYLWRIIIFGLIPMFLILIFLHAPMGTPNPGSAVRYRAGFEYLLTLPFLAMITALREVNRRRSHPSENQTGQITNQNSGGVA